MRVEILKRTDMGGMRKLKRKMVKAPKAMCAHCGHVYWRKHWRHGEETGQVRCGIRTCIGYLWIFGDDRLGYSVARLDLDKRLIQAKLHVLAGRAK